MDHTQFRVPGRLLAITLAAWGGAWFGCVGTVAPATAPDEEASEEATPPPSVVASDGLPTGMAQGLPAVARVPLRRLNRFEYDRVVRDLLLTELRPAEAFPIDDIGNGFDNQGELLSISPLHAEHYDAAAAKLVDDLFAAPVERRVRVLSCNPDAPDAAAARACAQRAIETLVPRAYRRPARDDERARLMALVDLAVTDGQTAAVGLRLAIQAILISPHFLFRVERSAAGSGRDLDGHALASRLSSLLWASMPDDELFAAAASGALNRPEAIKAQVARMLADPKASGFVRGFAGQWLHTRRLDGHEVDPKTFPEWDRALAAAMADETYGFFTALLAQKRPVSDLLAADLGPADERLARHYGNGGRRRGILGQGSILTVTSYSHRTSPVLRGKWVLEQLMCEAPPPPPADVEGLETSAAEVMGTVRQVLEHHRKKPACRPCHAAMDEIGLGLEGFDATGKLRTRDHDGQVIDDHGALPDGRSFRGASELAAVLAADPRLPGCVANRLVTYALGRGVEGEHDEAWTARLAAKAATEGSSLVALLDALTTSDLFRKRGP